MRASATAPASGSVVQFLYCEDAGTGYEPLGPQLGCQSATDHILLCQSVFITHPIPLLQVFAAPEDSGTLLIRMAETA